MMTTVLVTLNLLLALVYFKSFKEYSYRSFEEQSSTVLSAVHSLIEHFLADSEAQLLFTSKIIENSIDNSKEFFEDYFKYPPQRKIYINEYKLVNSEGRIINIYPFDSEKIGTDVSGQQYFKDGILAHSIHWSHAILSSNEYKPVLNITIPIKNNLLVAEMTFLPMLYEIEEINTSNFGNIGVMDEKGMYILHSNIKLAQERTFSFFHSLITDKSIQNSGIVTFLNEKHYYASIPLEEISGTIIFYQSLEYFNQNMQTIIFKLLLISIAVFIIYLIIAVIGINLIRKPISLMQSNIESVAKGEFSDLVVKPIYSEFKSLFNSIHVMSTQIEEKQLSLAHALKEAEEANEIKTQFLANMSHELRTPLNGIFGMTSLLNGTTLDDAQKKYLEYLKISSETLLRIIEDLLIISRIEAGKLALNLEPVMIQEIFNYTINQIVNEASLKKIEFNYHIEAPSEYILLDKVKINQIVINLLINAVKFTQQGSITFHVFKDTDNLILDIIDTGIGISKKNQQRIFKSFVQLEDTFSKNYQGLGLGLAITNNLVELHGGKIELESTPGEGSHFRVILPFNMV